MLGASVLALSGCTSVGHVRAWEYKIVPSGNSNVNTLPPSDWTRKQEALLDSLGKDGWILVTESNGYFYLRRPER
jgi:hypothetical protein